MLTQLMYAILLSSASAMPSGTPIVHGREQHSQYANSDIRSRGKQEGKYQLLWN
jgi:hypothetical protein